MLVSNVVHDLVAGLEVYFHESREVELKGLTGLHRLYAVDLIQQDKPPATTRRVGHRL